MNRYLVLAIVLAILGPACSPATSAVYAATNNGPRVAAGVINAEGHIVHGAGFSASRVGKGEYVITFTQGYFPGGCAAMVLTLAGTASQRPIGVVKQHSCDDVFYIVFFDQISSSKADTAFQFVAAEVQ